MLVIEWEVLGDHIGAGYVGRFRTGGGLRPVEDEIACLFMPKGVGFGLAICKEILEHSGGTIRVESELGKGSNFVITMPCTEQQARLSLRQKARDTVPGLCF